MVSRLTKIQIGDKKSPFDLFQEWFNCAHKCATNLPFNVRVMNIATVSRENVVSNRSVLMQEIDNDNESILFNTTKRSRKHQDIQHHPQVSLCFYWSTIEDGAILSRQVRMEGIAKEMDYEFTRARFRSASFRTQFRMAFCQQGNEVPDWKELQKRHEQFMTDNKDKTLEMPPETVYYQVLVNRVEFYESLVDAITIADRILYRKNEDGEWSFVRLEA